MTDCEEEGLLLDGAEGFDEAVEEEFLSEDVGAEGAVVEDRSTADDVGSAAAGAEEEPSVDSVQETRLIVSSNDKSKATVFFIHSFL